MKFQIDYDQTVDAAYLCLENKIVLDSEEIADGIIIDYDHDNNIIGIELLGLKTINPKNLDQLMSQLPQSIKTQIQQELSKVAILQYP